MQIAQRTILLIALVLVMMNCILAVYTKKTDKCLEQWEQIRAEEFLQNVRRRGEISIEEYAGFIGAVNYFEEDITVRLEIYRKEWDIKEKLFYYLISHEELMEQMDRERTIALETWSMVKVTLQGKSKKNSYQIVIFGKE